jgi:hypothetical protein
MNSIYWTPQAARHARDIEPDSILELECAAGTLMRVPEYSTEPVIQTGPDRFELHRATLTLSFAWSYANARVVVLQCGFDEDDSAADVPDEALIPHDVVIRTLRGASCARAWREYLRVTQFDLATRLGVSQPTLSASERTDHLRRRTRERLAHALNISEQQLIF